MGLYDGISSATKEILHQYANGICRLRVYSSTEPINNSTKGWLAIVQPFLSEKGMCIEAHSEKYYYKQSDIDEHFPKNTTSNRMLAPFDQVGRHNAYTFNFVETTTGTKIYDYANSLIKALPNDYSDKQNIAVALTEDKFHRVKVVISGNAVWILTSKLTDKLVQTAYALFPFIFEIDELTQDENIKNCFRAVTKDEPIKPYIEAVFGSLDDIINRRNRDALKVALEAKQKNRIRSLQRNIESNRESIRQKQDAIQRMYEEIEQYMNEQFGLEARSAITTEKVEELLAYINKNQYIKELVVDQNEPESGFIKLSIVAPITIYEPEPLERMIQTYLKDDSLSDKHRYILRAFLRIFKDEELQMICQSEVHIDLTNTRVNAKTDPEYNYDNYNFIFQPHVTIFNCWGENENGIREAIRENDFLGMINNILIAVQNINFTDSTVFNRFVTYIKNVHYWYELKTCKSKADGELWSIKDIVEQLKREDSTSGLETSEEVGHPELEDTIPF